MNNLFLLVLGSCFITAFPLQGAKIGFRFYHKHEYENLIAEPVDSFPITHEYVSVIQFANNFTTIDVSKKVRNKFKTDLLVEEAIMFGPQSDANKNKHIDLVKRIQEAEKAGWDWDHIIPYREPSFDFSIKSQDLSPGPWFDLRLISEKDIDNLRKRLSEAHKKGILKKKHYSICPLIYSWKNIGDKEKDFLKKNADGVYIELNPRDGRWVTDGSQTIFKNNYKKGEKYIMSNFGVPGTYDCAEMAKKKARVTMSHGPEENFGGVLLSHQATLAVPSALRSLTSEFGMGSGGTFSKTPPKTCRDGRPPKRAAPHCLLRLYPIDGAQ